MVWYRSEQLLSLAESPDQPLPAPLRNPPVSQRQNSHMRNFLDSYGHLKIQSRKMGKMEGGFRGVAKPKLTALTGKTACVNPTLSGAM
jgi:hypothetical protein